MDFDIVAHKGQKIHRNEFHHAHIAGADNFVLFLALFSTSAHIQPVI